MIQWDEFLQPYKQAVNELTVKFSNIRQDFITHKRHSPIEQVEGRVKKPSSILEKARRKDCPLSQNEIEDKIEDIAGIRIICRFVEDISTVVNLVRQRSGFDINVVEERDYVTSAKPSGYRSYHVIALYKVMSSDGPRKVVCEIQVRTLAMNFWATIEHSINYKYNQNIPDELKRRLYSSAEAAFLLDNEMGQIRGEMLEAQKVMQIRQNLVDNILENIRHLYSKEKMSEVSEWNNRFLSIYADGDLDKLHEIDNELRVVLRLYGA
jgi:putative GTP pyrophosphokinase